MKTEIQKRQSALVAKTFDRKTASTFTGKSEMNTFRITKRKVGEFWLYRGETFIAVIYEFNETKAQLSAITIARAITRAIASSAIVTA